MQEIADRLDRNRGDRLGVIPLHLANPRAQVLDDVRPGQPGMAVDHDQNERFARIDEMRIPDMAVAVPKLRPLPGIAQEIAGDSPQRIALLADVLQRRILRSKTSPAAAVASSMLLKGWIAPPPLSAAN